MKSVLERLRELVALDDSGAVSLVGPPMMAISAFDARWLLEHIELLEAAVQLQAQGGNYAAPAPRVRHLAVVRPEPPDDLGGGAA